MATLQAIKYNDGNLEILDQLLLPESCTYISINNVQDALRAIYDQVCGLFFNVHHNVFREWIIKFDSCGPRRHQVI
jgi:hypothetical protein